jgi:hypothetical protein
MEALAAIYLLANECGLFTPLLDPDIRYRLSLYVDGLVVFVAPTEHDFTLVKAIIEVFAEVSGLHTNIKCQLMPIRCTDQQIMEVQQWFPA